LAPSLVQAPAQRTLKACIDKGRAAAIVRAVMSYNHTT